MENMKTLVPTYRLFLLINASLQLLLQISSRNVKGYFCQISWLGWMCTIIDTVGVQCKTFSPQGQTKQEIFFLMVRWNNKYLCSSRSNETRNDTANHGMCTILLYNATTLTQVKVIPKASLKLFEDVPSPSHTVTTSNGGLASCLPPWPGEEEHK